MKYFYQDFDKTTNDFSKQFDPEKRYGTIDPDGYQIYDDTTYQYKAYLPPDYYMKQIKTQHTKNDGEKWFIRPHHLETVTNHYQSIKDDFMNTNYFSHFNLDLDRPKKKRETVECLSKIRTTVDKLKAQQRVLAEQPDLEINLEKKLEETRRWAEMQGLYEELEKFLKDKTVQNKKQLIIDAYEAINTLKRVDERELLN